MAAFGDHSGNTRTWERVYVCVSLNYGPPARIPSRPVVLKINPQTAASVSLENMLKMRILLSKREREFSAPTFDLLNQIVWSLGPTSRGFWYMLKFKRSALDY